MSSRANTLYLAVSPDAYELPFAVAGNLRELSKLTGVKENNISSAINRNANGKIKGIKFLKIKLESEVDNDIQRTMD